MPPRSHALLRRELGARAKGMKSMSTRGEGKGSPRLETFACSQVLEL